MTFAAPRGSIMPRLGHRASRADLAARPACALPWSWRSWTSADEEKPPDSDHAGRPARRALGAGSLPGRRDELLAGTHQALAEDPLPILLDCYERYGSVFTLRLLHSNVVFMLGPEANHHILVSHASNFVWRDGHFRDLIGMMGDGLLTIDGDFHRRSRLIMLPAFHREHIAESVEVILAETTAATEQLTPGATVDLYAWTRHLAMRVAMRALFGLDPTAGPPAASTRRACSRRRWASTRATTCCGCCEDRAAPGRACRRPCASSTSSSTRRSTGGDPAGNGAGHPQPAARRRGRGRQPPQRHTDPRRGDDAPFRRARHNDLDGLLHVL